MERRRNLKDAARDPLAKKENPAPPKAAPASGEGRGVVKAVAYMAVGLVAGLVLGRLLPIRFLR